MKKKGRQACSLHFISDFVEFNSFQSITSSIGTTSRRMGFLEHFVLIKPQNAINQQRVIISGIRSCRESTANLFFTTGDALRIHRAAYKTQKVLLEVKRRSNEEKREEEKKQEEAGETKEARRRGCYCYLPLMSLSEFFDEIIARDLRGVRTQHQGRRTVRSLQNLPQLLAFILLCLKRTH